MATPEERFWKSVEKGSGCWNWIKGKIGSGYGAFYPVGAKQVLAHRFSWQLKNGPIEDGLFVLHKCDNPACVRPDHLFLGTVKDNSKDCSQKGRCCFQKLNSEGENNSQSKFSDSKIADVFSMRKAGAGNLEISKHTGISSSHVCNILVGRARKTLTKERKKIETLR